VVTDREDPLLRTSYFQVLIADREVDFAEVTRLTSRADGQQPTENRHGFETVVLRRALGRSSELYDWRRHIADGADDRRDVTIRQLESPNGSTANSWTLVGAWPTRWSGPAFDARTSAVAIEELELAFDDLVWNEQPRKEGG
jgi:phage tail-like protein